MGTDTPLRYLATQDVGNVSDTRIDVESADGCNLGRLDGFMVDSDEGLLRYYVVSRFGEWGMKLGLVPFVPGCLDAQQGVLRLLDYAAPHHLG